MAKINCPSCKEVDMVQKISSIVGGETHKTRGESVTSGSTTISGRQESTVRSQSGNVAARGTGTMSGTGYSSSRTQISAQQQSILAQMLLPPEKPEPPAEPKKNIDDGWVQVLYWATGIIALIFACRSTDGMWDTIGGGFAALFQVVIITFGAMFAVLFIGMRIAENSAYPEGTWEKILDEHNKEVAKFEKGPLNLWRAAMERWTETFYCRRCDKVYVPGEKKAAPIDHFENFLYQ